MKEEIGQKINQIRNEKNMTLKDLSEKTDLSVGFLSQVERGLTSIAILSLKNIAEALEVDLSVFFSPPKKGRPIVLKSYEQEYFQHDKVSFIYSKLSGEIPDRNLEMMMVTLLPCDEEGSPAKAPHEGEEFIYVLEGILTLYYKDEEYVLYPGDSAHYEATEPHTWRNRTNKLVKLLSVNTPRIFNE
ncbi:HTH-type transcriptional regulator PuuR [bioreactor metagenome]|uniref:HTH-type transcriptional regulator PuuR n=1 Tax=bioreactor metagenome TaxID=1076179 RepID=A0A645G7N9_9ZZZZ|nr:XRE family transcriptional regulator [Lutispora sp.]MEA4960930.1 XRE family transcriptional regulator [Lutispora sp.]HCJ58179.1 DNA-binding protein [Clostridiaceae bacterium]